MSLEGGGGREGMEVGGRRGREGAREKREGGEGERGGREGGTGGMTVIHILMEPQYLNNNHVLRNNVSRRSIVIRRLHAEQWYVITSDVTWTPRQSPSQINSQELVFKQVLSIPV